MQPAYAPLTDRSAPVLCVEAVTKRFGEHTAVQDLSLTVTPGEIVGLLGPNGAGKTTTMRLIAGLLRPTQGRMLLGGSDVAQDPVQAKRHLFFVPDTPAPFSGMSGGEYLQFVASVYGIAAPDAEARLAPCLREFQLDEHLSRRVSEYSHGMRQKVVLTAALMVQPPLLMLDEPLVGLDTRAAAYLKAALRRHAAARGGVLLSTHLMFLAEELCDRVVIINRSRMIAEGTPAALRSRTGDDRTTLEQLFLEMTSDDGQT